MRELLEMAGGSVTGRYHLQVGKNNQDAYCGMYLDDCAIAVVCDGCGSGDRSEVGAQIGARLVASAIVKTLPSLHASFPSGKLSTSLTSPSSGFWERVRQSILAQLHGLVVAMDNNSTLSKTVVHHYFLFTIVGALVTRKSVTLFSIGDGVIILNGIVNQLGPFAGNAPPYLAYSLLYGQESGEMRDDFQCHFQIHHQLPIEKVESILIGTDGVLDLIRAAERSIPGKSEPVGAISQFWQEDRYFNNPDAVRRQLSLINRSVQKTDWQNQQLLKQSGLLPDDTTLIAIRKRVKSKIR